MLQIIQAGICGTDPAEFRHVIQMEFHPSVPEWVIDDQPEVVSIIRKLPSACAYIPAVGGDAKIR